MAFVAGVLTAPTGGTATTLTGFTWTASAGGTGAVTEQLERSTDGGATYAPVAAATASPANDAGPLNLSAGIKYRVNYTDTVPSTVYSNVYTFTPLAPGVLSAPTGGTTSTLTGFTWTAATGGLGAVTKNLQRSSDGGNTFADVAGANASPANDPGPLSQLLVYPYRTRYTDVTTKTVYSPVINAQTPGNFAKSYAPKVASVTVFPNGVRVGGQGVVDFDGIARGYGDFVNGVTFAISAGSINAATGAAVMPAPAAHLDTVVTVTCTSIADGTVTGTATVTVPSTDQETFPVQSNFLEPVSEFVDVVLDTDIRLNALGGAMGSSQVVGLGVGAAGRIVARMADGLDHAFVISAPGIINGEFRIVRATGTTATGIRAAMKAR